MDKNTDHPNSSQILHKKKKAPTPKTFTPEQSAQNKKKFVGFTTGVVIVGVVLFIISVMMTKTKTPVTNKFMITHIFPAVFFACMAFIDDALLLIGNDYIEGFFTEFNSNLTFDLGFVAFYTGFFAILLADNISRILEKLSGINIESDIYHDIGGYIFGKVVLLSIIYFFNFN
jgi:magnesium-transporting ATPase (P-type)